MACAITYNNFEISLVVFIPNITTNHGIAYTYRSIRWCPQWRHKSRDKIGRRFLCGRFIDLEILMAINFDVTSLLKRTLNQCEPVFFKKSGDKRTFVSMSHWRVCLGHGRVLHVCGKFVSAGLFTVKTLRFFPGNIALNSCYTAKKFTIN